jgi:hypothetical protein
MKMLKLVPCVALLGLVGCISPTDEDATSVEEDLQEFEQLKDQLFQTASVFVDRPAQTFRVAGNTLYWIDAGAGNPLLKSYDDTTAEQVTYDFNPYLTVSTSPNPIDNLNYAVSTSVIASMNVPDMANLYRPGVPEELSYSVSLPAPPYGQKWWAYAVDEDALFVAMAREEDFVVQKWTPNSEEPNEVANLTTLIAPNVMGEFHDFAVSGDTLIFEEGNRIWLVDMTAAEARWVQNDERIGAADFDAGGAVYSQGTELYRYDWATDTRESVSDRIRAGYRMNKTFEAAHHPARDFSFFKWGSTITYEGNSGIFSFDMETGQVRPLLLRERDNSRVYRRPIVLENGTLFVKSLESESGAVGADGPTYRLGM